MKISHIAAAAAVSIASLGASAATINFGDLLSGAGAPSSLSFASLTVTEVGSDALFTLNAFGLDLFAGSAPFIGAVAVDGTQVGSVADVTGGSPVSIANGGGPTGAWDFRFDLTGPRAARLTDNESVSWTWVGGAGKYTDFALHVQGIDYGSTDSAWYVEGGPIPGPIPEPSTYALMLAGLGAVGWVARRRRAQK